MGVLGHHRIPKPKTQNPKTQNPKPKNQKPKPKNQKVLKYSIYFNHKIDYLIFNIK